MTKSIKILLVGLFLVALSVQAYSADIPAIARPNIPVVDQKDRLLFEAVSNLNAIANSSKTIPAASVSGGSLTNLDGENIQDDTIDDDSIDFGDVTGADLTLTDAGAVSATSIELRGTGTNTISTAAGLIDGEQIADDTIDDDSIDFSDVTVDDLSYAGALLATPTNSAAGAFSLSINGTNYWIQAYPAND
jgi:hypothetical protein